MYGCLCYYDCQIVLSKVFGRQLIHHVSQYYRANQLFEHFGIVVDHLKCV